MAHSEVGGVPLYGVGQSAQKQATMRCIHPSPRGPESEGITCCFHCLVYVCLELGHHNTSHWSDGVKLSIIHIYSGAQTWILGLITNQWAHSNLHYCVNYNWIHDTEQMDIQ